MEKIITRSFQGTPVLSGRKITGYSVVFNQQSELLYEGGRRFREIIQPGAVSMQMLDRCDIRMLLEHDSSRLLARSNKGQGTLSYSIDDHGVRFEFESPDTADGNFACTMLKRGDISGCSFGFSLGKGGDRWRDQNGIWLRTITAISYVGDFSIVSSPAYSGTSADVRHREEYKPTLGKYRQRLAMMEVESAAVSAQQVFNRREQLNHAINAINERMQWQEQSDKEMNELKSRREELKGKRQKGDKPHWWE